MKLSLPPLLKNLKKNDWKLLSSKKSKVPALLTAVETAYANIAPDDFDIPENHVDIKNWNAVMAAQVKAHITPMRAALKALGDAAIAESADYKVGSGLASKSDAQKISKAAGQMEAQLNKAVLDLSNHYRPLGQNVAEAYAAYEKSLGTRKMMIARFKLIASGAKTLIKNINDIINDKNRQITEAEIKNFATRIDALKTDVKNGVKIIDATPGARIAMPAGISMYKSYFKSLHDECQKAMAPFTDALGKAPALIDAAETLLKAAKGKRPKTNVKEFDLLDKYYAKLKKLEGAVDTETDKLVAEWKKRKGPVAMMAKNPELRRDATSKIKEIKNMVAKLSASAKQLQTLTAAFMKTKEYKIVEANSMAVYTNLAKTCIQTVNEAGETIGGANAWIAEMIAEIKA
ncbi:hypothetical protein M2103_000966 [Ereboglobus sp. PH5-5]|uniref:hypothetical protein n=1 Tax=unclassified Ereboglobus TaxID=2626932 RepID=UPI00240690D9|nr:MULTISPECIES: hypothetical protein [unclassified Ereboglobus]MDF9826562.1 hypothetical protein [Ereboglobus sp. PH5-10]MDF9832752.1 hypothetical protein [Ereboglobus sp. PH5-5]